MEQKNNKFILDLSTLKEKGDRKLEEFAKNEELNVEDVVDIIYHEAKRIGQSDKVEVSFEGLEDDDDSFKVVVKPALEQYSGTVIYPFEKIKSSDKEILLDEICGKITLYNKKEQNNKLTVTIEGVAFDLFSMTYSKVKEMLCNISDRKEKNGYIENEFSICFKVYGIKINKREDEDKIKSIDVYDRAVFFDEFEFKKEEEKYDVDITKVGIISSKKEKIEEEPFEIEIPQEDRVQNVEDKEKALEDKLSQKLKKFSLLKVENNEIENSNKEDISRKNAQKEDIKVIDEKENSTSVKDLTLQEEIEELSTLYEKQKQEQEVLEKRIGAKLEELKELYKSKKVEKITQIQDKEPQIIEEVKEDIKTFEIEEKKDNIKSYIIESYKGVKEQGKSNLALYLGETKDEIRQYFKTVPKEVNDFEEMEMYDNFYAYYDEEDKCTGIGVYNQEENKEKFKLLLFGRDLITMPYKDIVKLIKDHDYKAIEDEDGIISLEYGISVDPKEDKDYKEKICDVIHIFKKGYYDEVYNI